jgi:hypothetical protein
MVSKVVRRLGYGGSGGLKSLPEAWVYQYATLQSMSKVLGEGIGDGLESSPKVLGISIYNSRKSSKSLGYGGVGRQGIKRKLNIVDSE